MDSRKIQQKINIVQALEMNISTCNRLLGDCDITITTYDWNDADLSWLKSIGYVLNINARWINATKDDIRIRLIF